MRIKNYISDILNENVKQVIYAAIPLIFLGTTSAQLFLANEAEWFARFGSLIVAWALLNITRSRENYSRYLTNVEQNRNIRNHNHLTRKLELVGDSMSLTFDLHATQIAQINRKLGQDNPFVENSPEAIEAFGRDVEERLESAPWVAESLEMNSDFRDSEAGHQNDIKLYSKWIKFTWSLEVTLILWGTIQWGYGDLLVTWWWE